jgi:tape measure domain-containing protein
MAKLEVGVKDTTGPGSTSAANNLRRIKQEANSLQGTMKELEGSMGAAGTAISMLGGLLSSMGMAMTAGTIIKYADAWANARNQLALVTTSTADLIRTQEQLFALSQETRSAYEGTVTLYSRMARATAELGVSQEDMLTVTKAINQAFIISGATTAEANAAVVQLSQAFASGTLRGEELNSMLDAAPRLTRAIAAGMGIAVGKLKEYGEAGKLTSDRVLGALLSQASKISSEYGKMGTTVGQSWTVLQNAIGRYISGADSTIGLTAGVSNAMLALSKNIDAVATAVSSLAVGLAVLGASSAFKMLLAHLPKLIQLATSVGGLAGGVAALGAYTITTSKDDDWNRGNVETTRKIMTHGWSYLADPDSMRAIDKRDAWRQQRPVDAVTGTTRFSPEQAEALKAVNDRRRAEELDRERLFNLERTKIQLQADQLVIDQAKTSGASRVALARMEGDLLVRATAARLESERKDLEAKKLSVDKIQELETAEMNLARARAGAGVDAAKKEMLKATMDETAAVAKERQARQEVLARDAAEREEAILKELHARRISLAEGAANLELRQAEDAAQRQESVNQRVFGLRSRDPLTGKTEDYRPTQERLAQARSAAELRILKLQQQVDRSRLLSAGAVKTEVDKLQDAEYDLAVAMGLVEVEAAKRADAEAVRRRKLDEEAQALADAIALADVFATQLPENLQRLASSALNLGVALAKGDTIGAVTSGLTLMFDLFEDRGESAFYNMKQAMSEAWDATDKATEAIEQFAQATSDMTQTELKKVIDQFGSMNSLLMGVGLSTTLEGGGPVAANLADELKAYGSATIREMQSALTDTASMVRWLFSDFASGSTQEDLQQALYQSIADWIGVSLSSFVSRITEIEKTFPDLDLSTMTGFEAALAMSSRAFRQITEMGDITTDTFQGALEEFRHLKAVMRPEGDALLSLLRSTFSKVADNIDFESATFTPLVDMTTRQIRDLEELIASTRVEAAQRASKAVIEAQRKADEAAVRAIYSTEEKKAQERFNEEMRLAGGDIAKQREAYLAYEKALEEIRKAAALVRARKAAQDSGVLPPGDGTGGGDEPGDGGGDTKPPESWEDIIDDVLEAAAAIPWTDAFPVRKANTYDDLHWTTYADAIRNVLHKAPVIPWTDAFPVRRVNTYNDLHWMRYSDAIRNVLAPAPTIKWTEAFPVRRVNTFNDLGWMRYSDAIRNVLAPAPVIKWTEAFPVRRINTFNDLGWMRWSDAIRNVLAPAVPTPWTEAFPVQKTNTWNATNGSWSNWSHAVLNLLKPAPPTLWHLAFPFQRTNTWNATNGAWSNWSHAVDNKLKPANPTLWHLAFPFQRTNTWNATNGAWSRWDHAVLNLLKPAIPTLWHKAFPFQQTNTWNATNGTWRRWDHAVLNLLRPAPPTLWHKAFPFAATNTWNGSNGTWTSWKHAVVNLLKPALPTPWHKVYPFSATNTWNGSNGTWRRWDHAVINRLDPARPKPWTEAFPVTPTTKYSQIGFTSWGQAVTPKLARAKVTAWTEAFPVAPVGVGRAIGDTWDDAVVNRLRPGRGTYAGDAFPLVQDSVFHATGWKVWHEAMKNTLRPGHGTYLGEAFPLVGDNVFHATGWQRWHDGMKNTLRPGHGVYLGAAFPLVGDNVFHATGWQRWHEGMKNTLRPGHGVYLGEAFPLVGDNVFHATGWQRWHEGMKNTLRPGHGVYLGAAFPLVGDNVYNATGWQRWHDGMKNTLRPGHGVYLGAAFPLVGDNVYNATGWQRWHDGMKNTLRPGHGVYIGEAFPLVKDNVYNATNCQIWSQAVKNTLRPGKGTYIGEAYPLVKDSVFHATGWTNWNQAVQNLMDPAPARAFHRVYPFAATNTWDGSGHQWTTWADAVDMLLDPVPYLISDIFPLTPASFTMNELILVTLPTAQEPYTFDLAALKDLGRVSAVPAPFSLNELILAQIPTAANPYNFDFAALKGLNLVTATPAAFPANDLATISTPSATGFTFNFEGWRQAGNLNYILAQIPASTAALITSPGPGIFTLNFEAWRQAGLITITPMNIPLENIVNADTTGFKEVIVNLIIEALNDRNL